MTAVSLWRHVKFSRKGRLRNCIILLCLVIAPVICALIFSESMMNGIANKYICLSDGHLQANSYYNPEFNISDSNELSSVIYSADKVVSGYVLLYSSDSTATCMLKGVQDSYFNEKRSSELKFEKTTDNENSKLNGISISKSTAKELGVQTGDKLAMIIVQDSDNLVLRPSIVYVKNIFYTGYDKLDQYLCFANYYFVDSLFKSDLSENTEILVNDNFTSDLDYVCSLIGDDVILTKWTEHNASVYSNFMASREAIFIVLATIIVVASFYTASVAQQLIQDDFKDIATIKLIGSSDTLIRKWAFTTVFGVTVTGTAIGTVLGIVITYSLGPVLKYISSLGLVGFSNYLLDFKLSIPILQIIKILLLMFAISSLSIFLSLRKTKSIRPVQLFTD